VAAGASFVERPYLHDPAVTSYGDEAAEALGEPPERIFKTLVTAESGATGPGLVVAVIPVPRRLDLKALAQHVRTKKLVMASEKDAERATGYLVGGISPLGQKRRLPTVIDLSALALPYVLVSGGRRGLDLQVSPADLVELTDATTAAICR